MIRLENISKYYVGNNEIALGLRKVNLEFELGEMVAITGESGSGKSTLLNVLSGSDSYEDGEMYINNCPTSYFDEKDWEEYRRNRIGFIYQNYNLIDSYTVYENVNVALVIKGSVNDNKEKVLEYLDRVGIKNLANKKASQLSSGQKQRLAIARALAKETDIIVADEPTGNLDSVNSAEVMEILNKLAEDKLVFVVTHNYDQIEPYATRKIRMYDGEVAEDINIRPKKLSSESIVNDESCDLKTIRKKEEKAKNKVSTKIVNLNRKNKPITFAFLMVFMIAISLSFFILLGGFFVNLDNTTSKTFNNKNFKNDDMTRIVVRNGNGKSLLNDDAEKLRNIKYVEQVDLFDSVSDTYYLLEENVDYKIQYTANESKYQPPSTSRAYAVKRDKYMKTVFCLSDDDLKDGHLAEELYDIVLYSEDESVLGTTISFYIGNDKLWGTDLAYINCKITGLLKEKTDQIYFSKEMGKMMTVVPKNYASYFAEQHDNIESIKSDNSSIIYAKDVRISEEGPQLEELEVESSKIEEYMSGLTFYKESFPIFIINKNLVDNEIIISQELVDTSYKQDAFSPTYDPYIINNIFKYSIRSEEFNQDLNEYRRLLELGLEQYNEEQLEIIKEKVEEMEKISEGTEIFLVSSMETTTSTSRIIEISQDMFDYIMGERQSTQMALYIKDYAYTEDVLDDLGEIGYEAASVYRMAALEYDYDIVQRKAVSMGISLGACILIFFIGVFIIGLIMNLHIKDFNILRLLGLDRESLNHINNKDILINMIISVIVSMSIIAMLNIYRVTYIVNIVKYYKLRHYVIYAIVVLAFILLMSVRSKAKMKKMV